MTQMAAKDPRARRGDALVRHDDGPARPDGIGHAALDHRSLGVLRRSSADIRMESLSGVPHIHWLRSVPASSRLSLCGTARASFQKGVPTPLFFYLR
jgi:hypothetical protein